MPASLTCLLSEGVEMTVTVRVIPGGVMSGVAAISQADRHVPSKVEANKINHADTIFFDIPFLRGAENFKFPYFTSLRFLFA